MTLMKQQVQVSKCNRLSIITHKSRPKKAYSCSRNHWKNKPKTTETEWKYWYVLGVDVFSFLSVPLDVLLTSENSTEVIVLALHMAIPSLTWGIAFGPLSRPISSETGLTSEHTGPGPNPSLHTPTAHFEFFK